MEINSPDQANNVRIHSNPERTTGSQSRLLACDSFKSEKPGRASIGVGVGIGFELLKPVPIDSDTDPENSSRVTGHSIRHWLEAVPASCRANNKMKRTYS